MFWALPDNNLCFAFLRWYSAGMAPSAVLVDGWTSTTRMSTPSAARGMGEIGIVGTAAAVANAVHHATGMRIRDLPVTLDKLLGVSPVERLLIFAGVTGFAVMPGRQGRDATAPRIEVSPTADIDDAEALSRVYTPGVADDCRAIADDPGAARRRTLRGNSVAVVSDGSAVPGLGDIGARAALPVRARRDEDSGGPPLRVVGRCRSAGWGGRSRAACRPGAASTGEGGRPRKRRTRRFAASCRTSSSMPLAAVATSCPARSSSSGGGVSLEHFLHALDQGIEPGLLIEPGVR
jgi:Malic enzyme, N-terminal domain